MDKKMFAGLILISISSISVYSYPDGATSESCSSMFPEHSDIPAMDNKKNPPPYSLIISDVKGNGTEKVPVTVTLKAKKGHFFKGFFIQVHEADRKKQDCHKKSIGKFQIPDGSSGKLISCFGRTNNTVTHLDSKDKTESSFVWIVPSKYSGNVIFRATVVESYPKIWMDIQSAAMTITSW